jgi:hypothetical protein
MVLTQKVTSLAFAVGDGQNQKDADHKGTELQKKHAIRFVPENADYLKNIKYHVKFLILEYIVLNCLVELHQCWNFGVTFFSSSLC